MSNLSVRGFVFLALLFIVVTAVVMVIIVLNQPLVRQQIGIPNTGDNINTGPRPSVTPTPHLIPPVQDNVHAGIVPVTG
jgi:hypothetical protein